MSTKKSAALASYDAKRDFSRTPEPRGKVARSKSGRSFVIQKHDASHLHYDFRLEHEGVLKSWAIPKGVGLKPGEKRLAVMTEDHPLAYGKFEGTIAKGEYGGGTVILWDRGTWEPLDDPAKGLREGKLKFKLHGEKLEGTWNLVRTRSAKKKSSQETWLLIKDSRDAVATTPNEKSVLSGRELPPKARQAEEKTEKMGQLTGAIAAPFPQKVSAALCTLVERVPPGDEWLHEMKFDGYRILAVAAGDGEVRLITRNQHDWTSRLSHLHKALAPLRDIDVVLDGEVVCLDDEGQSNFQTLQNSLSHGKSCRFHYYIFDVLYFAGHDLRPAPLHERRRMLELIFSRFNLEKSDICRLSPEQKGKGEEVFARACAQGWEGVISKHRDAPYLGQRTFDWVKTKCHLRQEFVILGYTAPKGRRQYLGALALGYYEDGELRYAGHVGTGFDQESLGTLAKKLSKLRRSQSPLTTPFKDPLRRSLLWVEPKLMAEVEFTGWTNDGRLRHPSFKGLREDKNPSSIVREQAKSLKMKSPPAATSSRRRPSPPRTRAKSIKGEEDGSTVSLTHPERVLYPDMGITKQDLAQYLAQVAPLMLPHVNDRPLAIVRCPDGQKRACFFQKHATEGMPADISSAMIPEKGGTLPTLVIRNVRGLVSLAQIGCLEVHPWGCLANTPDTADRLIFDLDPTTAVPWPQVVKGAKLIRDALKECGLVSFVKTSGGKGLHVVVPLSTPAPWTDAKDFTHAIAAALSTTHADLFTIESRKAQRGDRIYIDYLRNARGATHVAPYSTRARPGCPISTPLTWAELTSRVRADSFHFGNIEKRLRRVHSQDPWQDFFTIQQALPPSHLWRKGRHGKR